MTKARDYAAPLERMPGAHPPPQGELPFGPRNFGIHRIDRTQLPLEGSRFGYRFAGKNDGYRVLELGWRATAVLRLVDSRGRVRRILSTKGWQVGQIKDLSKLEIAFPADHPGFFRVDLVLSRVDGTPLGSYRDYFRVLKRSVDLRIAVAPGEVHPGESVFGLIENRGAGKVTVPGALEVEHFENGIWITVPQPPNPLTVAATQWWMDSGEVTRCYRFDVPADAAPGEYRFGASVSVANLRRRQTVYGAFTVAPPTTPSPAGS